MTDRLIFAQDDDLEEQTLAPKWKVLIVDDEPEIHNITRLVLSGFEFESGAIELVSAHSAKEAKEILLGDPEQTFAVALVDVVMETHHAGLDLIKWIREELDNHKIRLILRTGQPGEAPEEKVIREYDINDYKNKTELTALRLKTLFYSSLRSYRDIEVIERHRQGLEKIISASSEFIECDSLPQFASTILKQVALVLGMGDRSIICCAAIKEIKTNSNSLNVLAMNPGDESAIAIDFSDKALPDYIKQRLRDVLVRKRSVYGHDHFIGYFTTKRGSENLLYVALGEGEKLENIQHNLLEFFANSIAVAHENLKLREVIKESQRELSYIIGEAVEMRSKETGSHVKRVAHCSHLLATLYGLPDHEAELIKLAAPLHDVGKVGIPDGILNKPAKHDENEWDVMQTHAKIGHDMLIKSDNPVMQLGAVIAIQHHERWDGKGYPFGLKGEDIDIAGRITALIDVFDALGSKRCYKKAWPIDKIVAYIEMEKGSSFDPHLVDLLLENLDAFKAIREAFPD